MSDPAIQAAKKRNKRKKKKIAAGKGSDPASDGDKMPKVSEGEVESGGGRESSERRVCVSPAAIFRPRGGCCHNHEVQQMQENFQTLR